nr:MAG TPA: hypothetical protein [Caudoviricetes sp.]
MEAVLGFLPRHGGGWRRREGRPMPAVVREVRRRVNERRGVGS